MKSGPSLGYEVVPEVFDISHYFYKDIKFRRKLT